MKVCQYFCQTFLPFLKRSFGDSCPPKKTDNFLKHGHQNCMDSLTSTIDLPLLILFLQYGQRGKQRADFYSNLGQ